MGGAQIKNQTGEDQKKESSQFDLGFVIGEARNLVGDQFWIDGEGPNLKLQSGDRTSKTIELKKRLFSAEN